MADFKEQYLHPAWQKKRLEVLEHHGFACEDCGARDKTLHVHHRRYVKGRKVWEYERAELACLCDECHEATHKAKALVDGELARLGRYGLEEVHALLVGYRNGIIGSLGLPPDFVDAILPDPSENELHYWIGQVARSVSEDFTQAEAMELHAAVGHGPRRVLSFLRLMMERYRADFMEGEMAGQEVAEAKRDLEEDRAREL